MKRKQKKTCKEVKRFSNHLPSKRKLKHKETYMIPKRNLLSKLDFGEANSLSKYEFVILVEFREYFFRILFLTY